MGLEELIISDEEAERIEREKEARMRAKQKYYRRHHAKRKVKLRSILLDDDTNEMINRIAKHYCVTKSKAVEIAVRTFFIHKEIWPNRIP
ncbi:MAG: hypothetical protein J7J61_05550 [Candidatus Hydrothermae bacterium]|nr:hypothetical protein [Candidatus Hydrothermae bacterium]